MKRSIKTELKARSRLSHGLLNLLKDDLETIDLDIDSNDFISISESIQEAKSTIQKLVDNITELEYTIYLSKRADSR